MQSIVTLDFAPGVRLVISLAFNYRYINKDFLLFIFSYLYLEISSRIQI